MMKWKWQSMVAGCAVLVAFLFIVEEVDARRGGGGGRRGGGGKSISRSGPASGGSVRSQKPTRSQSSNKRKDVRDDRRDWYDDRRRRRIGTSLTISAFRSLSCTSSRIYVGGVTYYRCGHEWYSRAYHGGNVTYVIVTAPSGY